MTPYVFPVIFPLIFPIGFIFLFLGMMIASASGAWWPYRFMASLRGGKAVLLVTSKGDIEPGVIRRNAIGNVFAYSDMFADTAFGHVAHEDGKVEGTRFREWREMP